MAHRYRHTRRQNYNRKRRRVFRRRRRIFGKRFPGKFSKYRRRYN